MKRTEGERYVASNAYSLAQAWLYRGAGDVYPFAIYHDEAPVGFMMLDEALEERCQVSPHVLPKGAISQPHAHFQLLALGFPTLNSFSFQIYIQVFFLMLSKLMGTKGK